MVIKYRLGGLPLPLYPRDYCLLGSRPPRRRSSRFRLPTPCGIADLPEHYRNPFDRMIVARALVEGARVLTADRTLAKHDVELLRP